MRLGSGPIASGGSGQDRTGGHTLDDLAPVVIIAGPTASGKTELALKVAEMLNGEIINADSMQVYAELCIVTARPDAAELARAPHHLFGNLPASERCSAGRWLNLAKAALADIHARGRLPVVCGGTGLYLKALTDGLAAVPEVPDDMVQAITRHLDDVGGEAFRTELGAVDPGSVGRLRALDRPAGYARCVSACGWFPRKAPDAPSISSANRPTSWACATSDA